MKTALRSLFIVILLYIVSCITLYFFQNSLLFHPSKLSADYAYNFDAPFEEINLTSKDGATLNALHFKQANSKGCILYFHGNAGNLSRWGEIAQRFLPYQYDVLIMDYRSFGKSTGKLSEAALFSDAQLFYDYVAKQYSKEQIVLYGRSLGTGIASWLASKNPTKGVFLETPYYSIVDVAAHHYRLFPVRQLAKYELKSHEYLQKVDCPIFIFHGTKDRVVPYEQGKKLEASIKNKTVELYTIEGGNHHNLYEYDKFNLAVQKALNALR